MTIVILQQHLQSIHRNSSTVLVRKSRRTGGDASAKVPSSPLADAFSHTNWRESAPAADVAPVAVCSRTVADACTRHLNFQQILSVWVEIVSRAFIFIRNIYAEAVHV